MGTGNKDSIYKALALSTQIVFWELCNSIDNSSSSFSLQTQSHYIKIAYKIRKMPELRFALTQQIANAAKEFAKQAIQRPRWKAEESAFHVKVNDDGSCYVSHATTLSVDEAVSLARFMLDVWGEYERGE